MNPHPGGRPANAPSPLADFMAQAIAMEQEAAQRYDEAAHAFERAFTLAPRPLIPHRSIRGSPGQTPWTCTLPPGQPLSIHDPPLA